jgi:hypothetical protein
MKASEFDRKFDEGEDISRIWMSRRRVNLVWNSGE